MRLGRHIALLAIIFFHGTGLFSQIPEETYYFPVRPGEKNYLSGTMGEIRSTHFHTGIDIKTSGISGLRVYATRQGYISRIRVGASGYGNCLYISHPGGEVSVYGHLSEFREDIRKYVISEQYKRQTFEINLYPKPGKFPIDKGELIAFSGNSGSSSGPHLHFEIRDSLQNVLNPLQMKFGEIRDDIPPIVQSFSIRPLDIQARVKGQFENVIFTPERVNMEFLVNNPIEVYGLIGIQLQAHDKLSGAANKNGIPFLRMYFDDKIIFDARITRFNFNDAAHTPIYYDNALKMRTGRTFQKLYIDDGNNLPFYDLSGGNGKIYIGDTLEHSVEIVLSDLAGNKSVLSFRLKGALPAISVEDRAKPVRESLSCDILDN
ncbi:MAG TPA: M23 family metallopeptidase, partial [Cyclobacteriaceae bacterium]|nr:M23 family metallopeptidase [Cyclobacteriaceae bacterium]